MYNAFTPAAQMTKTDAAKLDRVNPRNFRAMTPATAMAMAELAFGIRYDDADIACTALEALQVSVQHALDKSKAKALAKRRAH